MKRWTLTLAMLIAISAIGIGDGGLTEGTYASVVYPFQFRDGFDGDRLSPEWTTGGYGTVGLDGEGRLRVFDFDDRGIGGDWHGPWARARLPASSEFRIEVAMECLAEGVSVLRVDVRALDDQGMQLLSFSWRDVSISDSRSGLTLFGGNDDDVLYASEVGFDHSVFVGRAIAITNGQDHLTMEIDGTEEYSGPPVEGVMRYVELDFLKYRKRCTTPEAGFDMISVGSVPLPGPEPPTDVRCSQGVSGGVFIEWDGPQHDEGDPVKAYKIYRNLPGSPPSLLTSVAGHTASYHDPSVTKGIGYEYRISTVGRTGEGLTSQPVSGIWNAAPPAPVGLQAISGEDQVRLAWSMPPGWTDPGQLDFGILRGQDPEDMTRIADVGHNLTFTDTGVDKGIEYFYGVLAWNTYGNGDPSTLVSALPGSPPGPPSEPRDLDGRSMFGGIRLTWDVPLISGNAAIEGYDLVRTDKANGSLEHFHIDDDALSYLDVPLEIGRSYGYALSCSNEYGRGGSTDELLLVHNGGERGGIDLNLTISNHTMLLRWDGEPGWDPEGVTGFIIRKGNDFDRIRSEVHVGMTWSYCDPDVVLGETYYYTIAATDGTGEGDRTSPVKGMIPAPWGGSDRGEDGTGSYFANSQFIIFVSFVAGAVAFFGILFLGGRRQKGERGMEGTGMPK